MRASGAKKVFCDAVEAMGGRTIASPNAATKSGFVSVESAYNEFMEKFCGYCSTFVSIWRKAVKPSPAPAAPIDPDHIPTANAVELGFKVETLTQEVDEYKRQIDEVSGECVRQAVRIKELEGAIDRLKEKSMESETCEGCVRLEDKVAALEEQLKRKDQEIGGLREESKQLQGKVADWQSKYAALVSMNESLRNQVEQLNGAREGGARTQPPREPEQSRQPRSSDYPQSQPQGFSAPQQPKQDSTGRRNPFAGLGTRPQM